MDSFDPEYAAIAEDSTYLTSWLLSSAAALVAAILSVSREDVSFGMGVCSTCLVGLLGSWNGCNKQYSCQFCLAFIILSSMLLLYRRFRLFRYRIFSLYILLRGRPKQNASAPIWRLSPDLIQYLTERFPPTAAAAFALTSKPIMNAVGQQYLKLEGEELLALLELFQSDLPNHLLCYQCSVFHKKSSMSRNEHLGCIHNNGHVVMALAVLPFTEAQQAMNNHLYGARHPVGHNQYTLTSENHRDGAIRIREQSEMRVSGAMMLFGQQITLSVEWEHVRSLTRNARDRLTTLCPHLRCSEFLYAPYNIWTRFECPVCGTEIVAYRRAWGGKHHDVFYLHIWRSLGPCRSPFESQWHLVTDHSARRRRSLPPADLKGNLEVLWGTSQQLPEPSLFARLFSNQFRRACRRL